MTDEADNIVRTRIWPRRRRIGSLATGLEAPTIQDVADAAGVSTATVSRALGDATAVKPETRARVLSAVATLGYTPNAAARNLRARRSMMALLIVPRLNNVFFADVIRGVDLALSQSGYGLIIGDLDDSLAKVRHLIDLVYAGHIDGVMTIGTNMPVDGQRSIADTGVPIVGIATAVDHASGNVLVDDRGATRAATRHLIGLGHRRLGYIGGPATSYNEVRRHQGFLEAAAEAGITTTDLVYLPGDYTFGSGARAAADFLDLNDRPTGIVATSDEMAMAFMKIVQDAGVLVPRDISVTGFDGLEFGAYCMPALTTIAQPRQAMGEAGARLLLSFLATDTAPPKRARMLYLASPLVERGSTGPAPQHPSTEAVAVAGSYSGNDNG